MAAVYLAYTGMQDVFLTEEPEFTYFKTIFKRNLQSTTQVVEHAFDQTTYRPGDTLIATLKQNGDYLMNVSLKLKLPAVTPSSNYWVYPNYLEFVNKSASFYYSNGAPIYSLILNGLLVTTKNNYWFSGGDSSYVTISNQKFVFSGTDSSCYVIFDDIETAHLFGFVYNPVQLFGGFVRFNVSSSNQVTFQECGWLKGDRLYNATYSYLDDTVYNIVNSVSLYIGKTLVQEFDSSVIKFIEYTGSSFKNKPSLKLLDGNDSIVDFERVYYFNLPFFEIPVHAMSRHDVQVRVKMNPLNFFKFYASLVLRYATFESGQQLPKKYTLPISQYSYFTKGTKLDVRGPIKKLILKDSNDDFKLFLNGEEYANSDTVNASVYENLKNTPPSETSNVVVFNNPINMSRIIDQKVNQNVYSETINVLGVMHDLSGLLFDSSETSDSYPIVTGNITNPEINTETYLFDIIPITTSLLDCFYSMRLVSPVYTGPIIRIRNSDTDEEADFYTDTTQSYLQTIDGTSIQNFGINLRVSVWYDQSLNKNNLTQTIKQFQPYVVLQNNGKYTVGILNDTTNVDYVSPTCWMDITTPVHSQQFIMSVKLNYVGTYEFPICLFATSKLLFRITFGSLLGNNTADDWAYWPGTGNYGFTVNGSVSTSITSGTWNAITGYQNNRYNGPDISLIGINGPGLYQTPNRSMNGYFFELGFMKGKSVIQEYDDYYANKPPVF